MRVLTRIMAAIVLLLILLAVVLPPVMGSLFEKRYHQLIEFFNSQGNVHIQVIHYQRGWFSAKAILNVEIKSFEFKKTIESLGIPKQSIPQKFIFTLTHKIQHGPIVYNPSTRLPIYLGIASIHGFMSTPPQLNNLLSFFGLQESPLKTENDLVSFTGGYFQHLEFLPIQFNYLEKNTVIKINQIASHIWMWPYQQHIKGNINIVDFFSKNNFDALHIPKMQIEFDQHRDKQGLWTGSSVFLVPEVILNESNNATLGVSGLNINGTLENTAGDLSSDREVAIKQIQMNGQSIGPFHLELSLNGFDAQAIINMMKAYEEIIERGELYEDQLQQKMLSLLPTIVNAGASINLKTFELTTPVGELKFNAKIYWPTNTFSKPESLQELIQLANLNADLKISAVLTEEIINLISKTYYINQLSERERAYLLELQNNINFNIQQNTSVMSALIQQKWISEQDGKIVLEMQKNDSPPASYIGYVANLYLSKKITRESSYFLYWQYLQLQQQFAKLEQQENQYQKFNAQQLRGQLEDLINQGYVVKKDNNFVVSILRQNGATTINGKSL